MHMNIPTIEPLGLRCLKMLEAYIELERLFFQLAKQALALYLGITCGWTSSRLIRHLLFVGQTAADNAGISLIM
jgi:hypothetical protein